MARAASSCRPNWPSSQSRARKVGAAVAPTACAVAAPRPVGSCRAHSRAHRVQNDVPREFEQVPVAVDDLGFETSLEQMPVEPVTPVELEGVPAKQPLHALRQVLLRRLDEEMDMVVHEAIRMARPTEPLDGVLEEVKEPLAVCIFKEDRLATVAARRDVEDAACRPKTRCTWHVIDGTRPQPRTHRRLEIGPLKVHIRDMPGVRPLTRQFGTCRCRASPQKMAISATPATTRAAPARRRGPTGSLRTGAASTTAMTTLDSRTAATDAAEASRKAAKVSP